MPSVLCKLRLANKDMLNKNEVARSQIHSGNVFVSQESRMKRRLCQLLLKSCVFMLGAVMPGTTETLGTVSLGDGDVATMEGLTCSH